MTAARPDQTPGLVAVIGAGSIGVAWCIVFARAGIGVVVHDPDPERLQRALAEIVDKVADLAAYDLLDETPDAIVARITPCAHLPDALTQAIHVQECAPEHLDTKRELFAQLDSLTPIDVPLATSSSAMTASSITGDLAGRERCLVIHPTNPPYLLPAVEVVPAPFTSEDVVARCETLLKRVEMSPIRVNAEVEGFVLNRLQGAILREAYCLVRDGVASVDDIDRVVRDGVGRRWALIGPFETSDLNTRGGIRAHAARLGPAYARMGAERGQRDPWTTELVDQVEAARRAELPLERWDERVAWRDRALMLMERARRDVERFNGGPNAKHDSPGQQRASLPRPQGRHGSRPSAKPEAFARISPGLAHSIDFVVSPELQTDVDGTLPLPVLASPHMIRLMERAAVKSVEDHLPSGSTTVGFKVSVRHVSAAHADAACTAHARLSDVVDGRKLRFDVSVVCGDQLIGFGVHERRLVDAIAR